MDWLHRRETFGICEPFQFAWVRPGMQLSLTGKRDIL